MSALRLPQPVVERISRPLVDEYERLVTRQRDSARKVARLDAELCAAQEADRQAEQEAVRAEQKLPSAKATALERKLDEAERELAALERAVADARRAVVDEVGDDLLAEVGDETRQRELAALERAAASLDEFEAAVSAANTQAGIRAWATMTMQRSSPVGDYTDSGQYDLPSRPAIRAELERRLVRAGGGDAQPEGFRLASLADAQLRG